MTTSSNANIFALLALCAGNSPLNYLHKDQWRGALMYTLICTWINGWVNNREVCELRLHRAHNDVTVMVRVTFPSTIRLTSPIKVFCLDALRPFRTIQWSIAVECHLTANHQICNRNISVLACLPVIPTIPVTKETIRCNNHLVVMQSHESHVRIIAYVCGESFASLGGNGLSCQIRKIGVARALGMPGTFSPLPRVSDPDMHHGTCVTHVP